MSRVKYIAACCGLCRRQRGFFLTELAVAMSVGALLAALVCVGLGRCAYSWLRLADAIRLQQAGRYMQSILEKNLAYDAVKISVDSGGQLSCTTVLGGKSLSFYCSSGGLYLRTRTNTGMGSNPLFMESVPVTAWQARRLDSRTLLLSFTLQGRYASRSFQQVVDCCNGVVTDV